MESTVANTFNLVAMYKEYFGKNPYHINNTGQIVPMTEPVYTGIPKNSRPRGTIHSSIYGQPFNKIGAYGQDIWHPLIFKGTEGNGSIGFTDINIEIDICTTAVQLIKNVIRTPIVERKGSVIEIFDIENPRFTIRGFLIGKNRTVPDQDIVNLQLLFESNNSVYLKGAYVELFLPKSNKIVISNLEFPEVQGTAHWIRPFTLQCECDFIEDLIRKDNN